MESSANGQESGELIAGRYRIEVLLGEGGMGQVWRAHDTSLWNRLVAVKRIRTVMTGEEVLARFEREIAALAKLNHPHIVGVLETGRDDEGFYYVMEFVPGRPLRAWLQEHAQDGTTAFSDVRQIFAQMSRAISAAHSAGVVHRDLKPENVLITEDGAVKILDFGLAKLADAEALTELGQKLGTPAYMSPEQCRGDVATPQSDIYALGVILFELCTLRRPFEADNFMVASYQHQRVEPPSPRTYRKDLPEPLDIAILRALEKDPAKRFPDPDEFRRAVEEALGSAGSGEVPRLQEEALRELVEGAWADGQLTPEEEAFLLAKAERMGIAEERAREIMGEMRGESEPVGTGETIFMPATPAPEAGTCPRCGHGMDLPQPGESVYCEQCGARIRREAPDDSQGPCPSCGSNRRSQVGGMIYCGGCGRRR